MLQFISFGSGSCGNCSCLSNGSDAVLIDAGVGIRRLKRNLRDYGVRTSLLRGILITHDHADHIKAAAQVAQEYNLRVYATERVHGGMLHNYRAKRKLPPERRAVVEPDVAVRIGSLSVTPFELPHDATENVGYCVRSGGDTFTVMTDVGYPSDNVARYVAASNYLVIEANYDADMLASGPYPPLLKQRIASGTGHLCNDQTAAVLAGNWHAGLRHVWLCHLSEENNHPELARKTVERRLLACGAPLGAGVELDVLRRGAPTGPWQLGGEGGVKAALFDLDGTIFDTEPQYSQFWGRMGRELHPEIERFEQIIKGTTLRQILDRYFPGDDLQRRIVAELDKWEAQMQFRYVPGAREFVEDLRRHGVKCAVVTSSNRKKMDSLARRVPDFGALFDRVLTAEDFAASKPDPDCYLRGASAFGATPGECVVFEDAFTGLEAGRRARMFTFGLATTNSASAIRSCCDCVLDDFTQLSYERLSAIVGQPQGAPTA